MNKKFVYQVVNNKKVSLWTSPTSRTLIKVPQELRHFEVE